MKASLISLEVSNFKGVGHWSHVFDGKNATITAENGKGKTSIADAVQWLLSDKDTQGKSSAKDLRPNDLQNNPIRGLTMAVKAVYDIDGAIVELAKSNAEVIKKGDVSGFSSSCMIDGEPMQIGEFKKYIANIIPADKLLTMTIPDHFCGNMHHTECRKILLDLIDQSIIPSGFDDLIADANGKTMEGYLKSLTFLLNGDTNNKGYKGEQKDISPRIDELTRSLAEYGNADVSILSSHKVDFENDIRDLQSDRVAICNQETERNNDIAALNSLKSDLSNRENELKNDTSGIQKYLDEKMDIATGIGKIKMQVKAVKNDIESTNQDIANGNRMLDNAIASRTGIAAKMDELEKPTSDQVCHTCKQALPDNMLKEIENKKNCEHAELDKQGHQAHANVTNIRAKNEEYAASLTALKESLEQYYIKLKDAESSRTERFAAIDAIVAENKTTPPQDDTKWNEINTKIHFMNESIGDPVTEQLAEIDAKIATANADLADINSKLANYDNAEKVRTRIKELNERETELGEMIVSIQGKIAEISEYKTAQNNIISESVNGKFKHVAFRMFKKNVGDDGVKDDCTALYKGNAYAQCSTGEKIIIDNDVMNTLSKHFGISLPRFIDNMESLTLPLECDNQCIGLVAKLGVNELEVS